MKVYFDGVLIEPDYYTQFKVSKNIFNDNDSFSLGSTICTKVTLGVDKTQVTSIPSKVTITLDDKSFGEYVVDSYEEDDYFITYTLTDKMINFNFKYDASTLIDTSSKTETDGTKYVLLSEILEDICSKANVTLATSTFIGSNKHISWYDNTITAREYIGFIAELNGGYAYVDNDNNLVLKQIDNNVKTTIDVDTVSDYKLGEQHIISRVMFDDGVGAFEPVGDETNNTLYLNTSNTFITEQDDIQNIYDVVKGIDFYSLEIEKYPINPFLSGNVDISIEGKSEQDGTPTPDEPVEITSLGEYNSETDKYDIGIKVTGKNLLNTFAEYSMQGAGVTVTQNSDGSLTLNGTVTKTLLIDFTLPKVISTGTDITLSVESAVANLKQSLRNSEQKLISVAYSNGTSSVSCTLPEDAYYYRIQIDTGITINTTIKPMLELGSTISTYEPYTEQLRTIELDEPLRSIGDVKDTLEIDKIGKVTVTRNIDEISSYNGEAITTEYISTTGELTTGATVDYVIPNSTTETYYIEPLTVDENSKLTIIANMEPTSTFEKEIRYLNGLDCIKFTNGDNEYLSYGQYDWDYNGGFIGGNKFIVNSEKQEETNVYNDTVDKVKSIKTVVDRTNSTLNFLATNTYTKTEIQQIADGTFEDVEVSYVSTEQGQFSNDGLRIQRVDSTDNTKIISETSTLFNETGMTINKVKDGQVTTDTPILFSGYVESDTTNETLKKYRGQSVTASNNMIVNKYLVVGEKSRMEEYTDETGTTKTGMFPL